MVSGPPCHGGPSTKTQNYPPTTKGHNGTRITGGLTAINHFPNGRNQTKTLVAFLIFVCNHPLANVARMGRGDKNRQINQSRKPGGETVFICVVPNHPIRGYIFASPGEICRKKCLRNRVCWAQCRPEATPDAGEHGGGVRGESGEGAADGGNDGRHVPQHPGAVCIGGAVGGWQKRCNSK